MTELFEKCPICGGKLFRKKVKKVLSGGVHTATVEVEAQVCSHCGERLYTPEVIRAFDRIREKLEHGEVEQLTLIGSNFKCAV